MPSRGGVLTGCCKVRSLSQKRQTCQQILEEDLPVISHLPNSKDPRMMPNERPRKTKLVALCVAQDYQYMSRLPATLIKHQPLH